MKKQGILIAAAILTAVTLCGCHSEESEPASSRAESSAQSTGKSETGTAENASPQANVTGLHLTDEEWCVLQNGASTSISDWYTEAESGWYHTRGYSAYSDPDAGWTDALQAQSDAFYASQLSPTVIWYYDRDSGEDVPLCARPNCLHNDAYCEAVSIAYRHTPLMQCGGTLYAAAVTAEEPYRTLLLSYAPDGTGITELCAFGEGYGEPEAMIIHRGYVWCLFRVWEEGRYYDMAPDAGSGFVIFGYEIATGKTTELLRCMPTEKNSKGFEDYPAAFTAGGDHLYFQTVSGDWTSQFPRGIYSIDLTSGKIESVAPRSFLLSAAKEILLYVDSDNVLHLRNLQTGEDTAHGKSSGETLTDGTYICTRMTHDGAEDRDNEYDEFIVYDMQMQPLGSISTDRKRSAAAFSLYQGTVNIALCGGHGFWGKFDPAQNDTVLMQCSIENIINGSAEWTPTCVLNHVEILGE